MVESRPEPERWARALMGVVAASALAYPLVGCAVQLVFAQILTVDVGAIVLWLAVGLACSVAFVAVLRWGAARRVRSPWLLLGVLPPVLFELWLVWPQLAR
jgi:small ligand-binding sensory domain FIST